MCIEFESKNIQFWCDVGINPAKPTVSYLMLKFLKMTNIKRKLCWNLLYTIFYIPSVIRSNIHTFLASQINSQKLQSLDRKKNVSIIFFFTSWIYLQAYSQIICLKFKAIQFLTVIIIYQALQGEWGSTFVFLPN